MKQNLLKKIGLSKEQLKFLLEKHNRLHICEQFNLSSRTLDRIIKENKLTKENFGPKNLKEKQIIDIKKFYSQKKYKQIEIAKKFGISQSLVSKIINNKSHKDTPNIELTGQASIRIGFKYGN